MNRFFAELLAWYHDPSRILDSFQQTQRRLTASMQHHRGVALQQAEAADDLLTSAAAHNELADRAKNVSTKLAALLA